MVEEILRAHRDEALKLLKDNRAQSREGIDVLVQQRLPQLIATIQNGSGAPLTEERLAALYQEVLDLSYVMFALGYTMAHTVDQNPAK